MNRCFVMHLLGFVGGAVAGASGAVGLVDKLVQLNVYPSGGTEQLAGLLIAALAAGLAAGVGLAATVGCYGNDD